MRRLHARSLLIVSSPQMDVEILIRTSAFALVFAAMASWELAAPRRVLAAGRKPRWPSNLGILVVDALAVRILIPTAAVGAACSPPAADGDCCIWQDCGSRLRRCSASSCSIW